MKVAPIVFRLASLLVALAPLAVPAQSVLPGPHLGAGVEGRVVDADDGHPVAGAIVVARWQWLTYTAPGFHSSGGLSARGDAIHVAETDTRADGRFRIGGWGPTLRGPGQVDERAPWLLVFKPGYAPLAIDARAPRDSLRLAKAGRTGAEQAAAIARFQQAPGPSLQWRFPDDAWRNMPRMVRALHEEKVRLGADGAPVLGANLLYGRSGEGEVVAERPPQGAWMAVVLVRWKLRRIDGAPGTQVAWQAKRTGTDRKPNGFFVSPWRLPSVAPPGWEIDVDAPPVVRAYAPGYRRSAEREWPEEGGTLRLEKLPEERDAVLAEAREWRRDVDAALGAGRGEAQLAAMLPMLQLLELQCRAFTPDLRGGTCFDPASDVAAFVERARRDPVMVTETAEGENVMRTVAVRGATSAASAVAARPAQGAAPVGFPSGPRAPVTGFSIERVKP